MAGERDWDKELAEIDKMLGAGTPSSRSPAPAPRPARAPAPAGAPHGPVTRRTRWGAWLRVALGVALAAGIAVWPYPAACGVGLAAHLGVIGTTMLTGIWGARTTWRHRMGLAHVLSLAAVLVGLTAAAAVLLPRVGYAKAAAAWFCP